MTGKTIQQGSSLHEDCGKTVKNYEEEKVTLEYVKMTREFREIKDYILQKGEQITVYTEQKEVKNVRLEDVLISRKYAKMVSKRIMEEVS